MVTPSARPLVLMALAGALACTEAPQPITGSGLLLDEPTEITLKVGEHHDINGSMLVVTFAGVSSDTRCPADVICVSEGNFAVDLGVGLHGTMPPLGAPEQLVTLHDMRPVEREGIRFEALGLDPLPRAGRPIDPDAYTVKLRLSPARH